MNKNNPTILINLLPVVASYVVTNWFLENSNFYTLKYIQIKKKFERAFKIKLIATNWSPYIKEIAESVEARSQAERKWRPFPRTLIRYFTSSPASLVLLVRFLTQFTDVSTTSHQWNVDR